MTTTLNRIREEPPCKGGWKRLLKSLGKTKADDEPLTLIYILESNGIKDAIWCLRCIDGIGKEIRLFGVACAREVQYLMTDQNSIDALDVAERFAKGEATEEELNKARIAIINSYTAEEGIPSWKEVAICTTRKNPFFSIVATIGAIATIIDNDITKKVILNEVLEKQKELFISFFGGEKENA